MTKETHKMQEDLSSTVAGLLPEQIELAKTNLHGAIENLLVLEKRTRQAEDQVSTSKVAVAIVKLCYEAKDFQALQTNLNVLAKRRGQFRTVVQDFVKEAMSYLEQQSLEKSVKMELLTTLRAITEGKMYVETERARLTKILAKIKEEEGKIAEAAEILQEIQVETFGQMDKMEKTSFILEQMRLCLDNKDYIKAQILSNKISKKALKEPEFQQLKLQFCELMIRYYTHDSKYLDISKAYRDMYDSPIIQNDEKAWKNYLQLSAVYACLSKHDNEQSDLMNRLFQDKNLSQLPAYKKLLDLFLTKELLRWPSFFPIYESELNKHAAFQRKVPNMSSLWDDLRKRVVEHNIRVIAEYYSRITNPRLSTLLDLPSEEAEQFISDLVVEKSIFAKIDRPKGIISFRKRQDPNEVLNQYGASVSNLLDVLEKTCHLIHRENMIHKLD